MPGRPVTYRTTAHFLRTFGMQSLADLPALPTGEDQDLFAVQPEDADLLEADADENTDDLENIETIENADDSDES